MSIAARIAPPDFPGTLFKRPAQAKPRPLRRQQRGHDAEHLEAIRQCPCISCGHDPCGEAAHVRLGSHAGIGRKPDDRRTTPLCHGCHMDQHAIGELTFWTSLGIAPLAFAGTLYRLSPNVEAMRAACFVTHFMARDR